MTHVLNAAKQLITAAGQCDLYVWSSKPAEAPEGLSSVFAVPSASQGLTIPSAFDGLGLRGNGSAPLIAKDVTVPASHLLGEDGKGLDIMLGVVMPFFSLQNCGVSIGMMEGAFERTIAHVTQSRFSYDGSRIADLPQVRGHVAKMRVKIDMVRGFLLDAVDAVEQIGTTPCFASSNPRSRARRRPWRCLIWACASAAGRRSGRTSASTATSATAGRRR